MALLKVFVSSTCYDLNMVRSELRGFIINLGHEPVMSDYSDILYNPADHTHVSCLKEIPNCDVIILIVGSRFGGKAISEAVKNVDIENLKLVSKSQKMFENLENISITQLEILKAIETNIPVFTFVDSKVLNDHLFYEKNKDKGFLEQIEFPSIDNKKAAIYIFEFINFLRFRSNNNSITEYSKISDIQTAIKKQWSALLQSLLHEKKSDKNEQKKMQYVSEELKDIKSLIMTSISNASVKDIARGVLRYRRLFEFFSAFTNTNIIEVAKKEISFSNVLTELDIINIALLEGVTRTSSVYLIKSDKTFYNLRTPFSFLLRMAQQWSEFKKQSITVKEEIINACLVDNQSQSLPLLRYRTLDIETYFLDLQKESGSGIIFTQHNVSIVDMELIKDEDNEMADYISITNDRVGAFVPSPI